MSLELIQMLSLPLNWIEEWWQSRRRLSVQCLSALSLGQVPSGRGDSLPFICEVEIRVDNKSTRDYEIKALEIGDKSVTVSELRKNPSLPQPERYRLWGKAVPYRFSWKEREVWWPFPFNLPRLRAQTRKLIIEAKETLEGKQLSFSVVGTDSKHCRSRKAVTVS